MFKFFRKKRGRNAIFTKNVRFSYSDKEILKNLSVEIKSGKITAIIGKSGSGKSTFLKILSGVISRNHEGEIRILGLFKYFSKSKVGFVPQEPSFIPDLSLEDNIKIIGMNFGISESKSLERSNALMEMLMLEKDLKKKPLELSGGERVRFNIVLSLLSDPEIIILDEPFVGLDFKNRRLLWHFIKKMKQQKKSIVLTSHLLSEIQENVDRIVLLRNGKVFFSGTLDSLKEKLKINLIYEVKFNSLSKSSLKEIRKYCVYYDIKILECYERHIMFSLESERKKTGLEKLFLKLKLNFEVLSVRIPNLDEIFMEA
jgi:ABC-2 type transport system ATP-binding protein